MLLWYFVGASAATQNWSSYYIRGENIHIGSTKYNTTLMSFTGASIQSHLKGVNGIDIRTKWFWDFHRFELSRVNLSHGSQNWFELSGEIAGPGNRRWNYRAWVKQIQSKQGLVLDIRRFEKSGFHYIHAQPLKRISYWKCFHNCGAWKHLHWLTGLQFLRRSDHLTVENIKVQLNRIEPTFSTCIESTLMMSRNDFNLCRIDLYRNDFVSKWPNSCDRDCNRTDFLYVYRIDFDDVSKRLQFVSNRLISKRLCIEMAELLWPRL